MMHSKTTRAHSTARLGRCRLGRRTGIGTIATLRDTTFGDYSCTIVGGVPAQVIRRRFTPAQAEALVEIGWWNWPHDALRAALTDIGALPVDDVSRVCR